jgi:hypothetical protein
MTLEPTTAGIAFMGNSITATIMGNVTIQFFIRGAKELTDNWH